jgi:hypothetical protein
MSTKKREALIETLKNQCFDRLKSKRKSIIDQRRRQNIDKINGVESDSKMKKNANKQIIDEAMIHEIIQKEMQKMDLGDLSINISEEVNQYLVKSISDESTWQMENEKE